MWKVLRLAGRLTYLSARLTLLLLVTTVVVLQRFHRLRRRTARL